VDDADEHVLLRVELGYEAVDIGVGNDDREQRALEVAEGQVDDPADGDQRGIIRSEVWNLSPERPLGPVGNVFITQKTRSLLRDTLKNK
jgi:hypothetical protein